MALKDRQGMAYASRQDVKRALDIVETARADDQIDRALASASDTVEALLLRRFYPEIDTRYFDWPDRSGSRPWRLWLGHDELISATTLTSGGTVITAADFFLEPSDGPPFNRIEIDLSSSASFSAGNTHQRAIEVAGVFGYSADTEPAGTITTAIDGSTTTVDISDGTALVGVGDLLVLEDERVTVTEKGFLDSTKTLTDAVAVGSAAMITVSDGSAFVPGEVLLVDAERMLVIDVNSNTLAVKRAWDGSTLAAHASAAPVRVQRRLTVRRGVLGTTAASHSTVAIAKHVVPPMVRNLAVAEAMAALLQERTGYARVIGAGEGESEVRGVGLADLRDQATRAYGRGRVRVRAV
ncbi:hypothetical protein [Promicromonospora sp. NPDC023805]|uniref:hypothetical protein n=1 Tax=Promicromonospora sp. NPDC023805 TaxID=3154696 RepID=UPI003401FC6E